MIFISSEATKEDSKSLSQSKRMRQKENLFNEELDKEVSQDNKIGNLKTKHMSRQNSMIERKNSLMKKENN